MIEEKLSRRKFIGRFFKYLCSGAAFGVVSVLNFKYKFNKEEGFYLASENPSSTSVSQASGQCGFGTGCAGGGGQCGFGTGCAGEGRPGGGGQCGFGTGCAGGGGQCGFGTGCAGS